MHGGGGDGCCVRKELSYWGSWWEPAVRLARAGVTDRPGRDGEREAGRRGGGLGSGSYKLLGGRGVGGVGGGGGLVWLLWSLSRVGPDQREANAAASLPGSDSVFLRAGMQPEALPRCRLQLLPRLPALSWLSVFFILSVSALSFSLHPHLNWSILPFGPAPFRLSTSLHPLSLIYFLSNSAISLLLSSATPQLSGLIWPGNAIMWIMSLTNHGLWKMELLAKYFQKITYTQS